MKTLVEIKERICEIRNLLESDQELNLSELETELRDLQEAKTDMEKREQLIKEANLINVNEIEARTIETFNHEVEEKTNDSMEYRNAFMHYVLTGKDIPAELRENQVTLTTDVGAVIPQTILNRIVEKMESVGNILSRVTRTAYKGGVTVPVASTKPVATWVAENAGSDTQKKALGSITFAYYKLRCAVAVSLEVDTVTLPIFENTLVNNIVEAMTKALEQSIISGTGSTGNQPTGIITETPVTGQAIETAVLEWETLTSAEGALPTAYENQAVWCMSKKTFMAFEGMTDLNNNPIARVNFGLGGAPERTILGRPVVLCDYLPNYSDTLEADSVFAFMFNFKDYILNTNLEMKMVKYEDHATDGYVTKAVMLADGKVVDKNSLVVLKKVAASQG